MTQSSYFNTPYTANTFVTPTPNPPPPPTPTQTPIPIPTQTPIPTPASASTSSAYDKIAQNLNNIRDDKQKIQEYIQLRNNATDPNIDITTTAARLDYTSIENKSLSLQMIILSSILLIIVIAIIIAYMS